MYHKLAIDGYVNLIFKLNGHNKKFEGLEWWKNPEGTMIALYTDLEELWQKKPQ